MSILTAALASTLLQTAAPAAEDPKAEFLRIGHALYDGNNPSIGAGPRLQAESALKNAALPQDKRLELLLILGKEYVKCGELDKAIETLSTGLDTVTRMGAVPLELRFHRNLALAYLRLAEQENCIRRHNAQCCIFPLEGDAIHKERAPGLKAREHYTAVLEKDPQDEEATWLLNITNMALGEYPNGVPESWRLPEKAFAAPVPFPHFPDVAKEAGVDIMNMAGGVAVEDYDGDGWLDILTSTCDPLGPLTFFHNNGDGTFADRSAAAHTSEQLGGLNLLSADYDNDGDFDAMILRGAWLLDDGCIRQSLLRNDAAVFTDVTRAAGVADPAYPSQAGVFADFDSDGWLDFYVGHESRTETEPNAPHYPSQLYRSRRDGTFENTTQAAGVANERYAKGVTAGDYDNDGDLDLFVSNIGRNRLYENRGDATFKDVGAQAGVAGEAERHFATWFFDYDNDGWLDLWSSGFQTKLEDMVHAARGSADAAVRPMLLHNQGDHTFEDRAKAAGLDRPMLVMGANFGDLDNDGWLDLYLGTGEPSLQALVPNVLLWNRGGKTFADVTRAAGMGHLQKGHGISFADFDHDGDQDVLHQLGGFLLVDRFRTALFANPGFGNHWLSLELVGTKTNRMASGARVRVVLETPQGERELHRAPGCVSSFGGSPHRQEIGLGDATRITRLEIRWPRTSELQVFTDVPLDSFVRATEGRAELERLERSAAHPRLDEPAR